MGGMTSQTPNIRAFQGDLHGVRQLGIPTFPPYCSENSASLGLNSLMPCGLVRSIRRKVSRRQKNRTHNMLVNSHLGNICRHISLLIVGGFYSFIRLTDRLHACSTKSYKSLVVYYQHDGIMVANHISERNTMC
jgi:hypothetical protein